MGHSLSALKRERQNEKRRLRNKANNNVLKKELKKFNTNSNPAKADLDKIQSVIDNACRKKAIPKGRANRKKSRLAKRLNKLAAAKPATPANS